MKFFFLKKNKKKKQEDKEEKKGRNPCNECLEAAKLENLKKKFHTTNNAYDTTEETKASVKCIQFFLNLSLRIVLDKYNICCFFFK